MKQLWSPWRKQYIVQPPEDECIFCRACADPDDRKHYVIHRGIRVFVMLNLYPYNAGHLLVAPFEHKATLSDLDPVVRAELMEAVEKTLRLVGNCFEPHGFNVGINQGRVAGAGVADHLHFHVVPRWNGDTNFMPLFGDVKVVNEFLDDTWENLSEHVREVFDSD